MGGGGHSPGTRERATGTGGGVRDLPPFGTAEGWGRAGPAAAVWKAAVSSGPALRPGVRAHNAMKPQAQRWRRAAPPCATACPGASGLPPAAVVGAAGGPSAAVGGAAGGPSAAVGGAAGGPSAAVGGAAGGPSAAVVGAAGGPSAAVGGAAGGSSAAVGGAAGGPSAAVGGAAGGPSAAVGGGGGGALGGGRGGGGGALGGGWGGGGGALGGGWGGGRGGAGHAEDRGRRQGPSAHEAPEGPAAGGPGGAVQEADVALDGAGDGPEGQGQVREEDVEGQARRRGVHHRIEGAEEGLGPWGGRRSGSPAEARRWGHCRSPGGL